jgi:hypothetical protein
MFHTAVIGKMIRSLQPVKLIRIFMIEIVGEFIMNEQKDQQGRGDADRETNNV